jgi:hypothetical protein
MPMANTHFELILTESCVSSYKQIRENPFKKMIKNLILIDISLSIVVQQ